MRSLRMVDLPQTRQDDVRHLDEWAWMSDPGRPGAEQSMLGIEWDRTHGAEVDGELAGIYSVYSLPLPVPGAQVPAAGVTSVGVHPQHRRRGVLTAMLAHHFARVAQAGVEPVSALFASEAGIYGRFGYGLGTLGMRLTIPHGAVFHPVPGCEDLAVTFERADAARHAPLVSACHEAARQDRPGMVGRPSPGLRQRILADQPQQRDGAEPLKILVVRDRGAQVRGYALFRRKEAWQPTGPDGTVVVTEAVALDGAASRVLWSTLAELDLTRRVSTWLRPTDDPLLHQLVDLRAAAPTLGDGLWVRLVDVAAALAGRRYAQEVDVVLEVQDPVCQGNEGRWWLRGGPDGASCERTSRDGDLRMCVQALGAAYLGGQTLAQLAAAGQVGELRPGTLRRASRALAGDVAPYCGWVF